ncbi:MAG: family 16 glycosylhydrolase [Planctomycetes bacterium]|nr:family 16 glycosylhydrolase [Planctomycetota bacterium]
MKNFCRLSLISISLCVLMLIQGCGQTLKVPQNPQFTLEWEDHFDGFDTSRWQTGTHTFKNNLVQFAPENVTFQDGTMRLHLKKEKTEERDFTGAEYRTKEKFLYGRYVVSARFPQGSGIVTSFFTFRAPPVPKWQEIDVEVLGKDTSHVQFTYFWGFPPDFKAETFDLDFTTDDGFHEYVFEWIPGQITWFVDGQKIYTATGKKIPHMAQQIMMNIWISADTAWAGDLDESALPTYTEYDYVKYYRLDPAEDVDN